MPKKIFAVSFIIVILISLCGCGPKVNMPFNGEATFHQMTLTIPTRFVRDSTQSSEDVWIFEHSNYKEYVIITRKDISGDVTASLENYVGYMKEKNADSSIVSFLDKDAVRSTYYLEDVYCQEILIPHNGSFYAIALRGGDAEKFQEIIDTITLLDATA